MGFFSRLREDIRAFDRKNTDESKVFSAHRFSCYRGVTVWKMRLKRSGSVGIIFLDPRENADTLRHEYGHTVQLRRLGLFRYLFCIGIPSWRDWGKEPYYDRPWEVTADVFGGVKGRTHSAGTILAGLDYLDESKRHGLRVLKGKRSGGKQ